jgi:Cellulase (glycosyl hydrolase family 5)
MTYGRKLWTVLIGCALLAALAFPASAPAARGLVTGTTGPEQYQSGDPATSALWFGRTVEAGAGIVRLPIEWRSVAPQRPVNPTNPDSYNFGALDRGVRDAAARGVQVLITVNSSPRWAEGPGRPASLPETASWKPNPSDLAQFMQAVAARYSGSFDPDGGGGQPRLPAVQGVQVLNEPNQDAWLAPQFDGATIIGPDQYRVLLNASYNAIKAVNPGMLVVTGGTSPYGDPPGGPYPPGGARVRPVQWWEDFLCVRAVKSKKKGKKKGKKSKKVRYVRAAGCTGKPVFDVFAHQAIDNTGKGPLQSGPTKWDVSTPDMGRLVPLLRAAERLGTVLGGRHQVWVTEFWWDSNPPNPVGAPLLTQARWIEQTLYLYWKAGADVAINFTIQDSTLYPVTRNGFQSGLYFLDGSPKPALTAFRFPFVTERINKRTLRAWGKSPEAGKLRIQRQRGKRWATVKKLNVGKGGVFVTKLRLRGKQKLRAVVGSTTSLVWKQAAFANRSSGGGGSSGTPILLPLIAGLALVLLAAAALRRRQSARRRRARFQPGRKGRLGSSTAS